MYLATLVPTILTLLATITAASPTTLNRRGLPGAYYACTGSNFSGQCSWTAPNTRCHIQGSPGIKSLGPDQGTVCQLFAGSSCTGNIKREVNFPGVTSLGSFGSFKCKSQWGWRRDETGEVDVQEKEFGAMKEVETEGREKGMIGLKKGTYY
jgi:hypothetical protein